ncbi:CDC6 [[Candida] subhashii]|uniref:Cell division control protein n=1 Tax=[Candida] subhashii TaxID=561895 RepID=A0A8J5UGZ1_9ASCO|nr:CDC6 [[Candida] subhashii]KAG7662793.1 CDC6 [[Candida] subhashii]
MSSRTPTRKRTIRDISNIQLLTPTKTPTNKRTKLSSDTPSPTKQSCRKKLTFEAPPTPTKSPKKQSTSIYSRAKALFQRGTNMVNHESHLVSRESEGKYLNDFFVNSINESLCNSLYISGPPGTGKTAQISLSIEYLEKKLQDEKKKVRFVKINCMTLNNPEHVFHEIFSGLKGGLSILLGRKKTSDDLFKCLSVGEDEVDSLVVILDELDSLITRDQQVLFQLFNCANKKNSHQYKTKLVVVGISNALDLTDKFLPRLIRNNLTPESMQFLPYTADQIKSIIISRLKSLTEDEEDGNGQIPIFHPSAIQLCCRKSASISGDLRKAFDICYKSIELIERSLPPFQSYESFQKEYPKVMIPHIAKICNLSFDNSSSIGNLNLLQKAILCQLFNYKLENEGNTDHITVNLFYDYYRKQDHINSLIGVLKNGEFIEIITALESSSCIVINDNNKLKFNSGIGNKLIQLNVSYDDIVKSIENVGILKRVLKNNSM